MKPLILTIIAALSIILLACGGEEPAATPPPQLTPTPVQDVQATVPADSQATAEAQIQATAAVVAAVATSVQATIEAQPTDTPVSPTNTPEPPTATPVPPTNTPVPPTDTPVPEPTDTPVPPTNTPAPTTTNTPEPEPTDTPVLPTNTPAPTATNTPKPTLTPTPTPLPYGLTWDNPVPIGQRLLVENVDGLTLRVREERVFWGKESAEMIDRTEALNPERAPRGHEFLLIDIQVNGHQSDAEAYAKAAATRLTVQASPDDNATARERRLYPDGRVYLWGGARHCGGQAEIVIPRDFALEHWGGPDNGLRGFICFIVTEEHSGRLVLVDNGGPGAPPEDIRYFSLRR